MSCGGAAVLARFLARVSCQGSCQVCIAQLGGCALGHDAQVARRNGTRQAKRGPPGLVNPGRTASVKATGACEPSRVGRPHPTRCSSCSCSRHSPTNPRRIHRSGARTTDAAAATPGDAASAASSAPAAGAATASSAALCKLHAELRRVGRLAVIDEELGKHDVGELFLSEGDHRKHLLRRGLLAIKNGGGRTARHRQRHACCPPHRQRLSQTFSLRSLLRARHRKPLASVRTVWRRQPSTFPTPLSLASSASDILTDMLAFHSPPGKNGSVSTSFFRTCPVLPEACTGRVLFGQWHIGRGRVRQDLVPSVSHLPNGCTFRQWRAISTRRVIQTSGLLWM